MFEVFLANLKIIGILATLFLGSFGANTLLGLYYQVGLCKEQFSKEKLLRGLGKAAIILVSSFFLTSVVSLLPFGLTEMGIVIDEALLEGLNLTAICGVAITAIIRYIKDALAKFYEILTHKEDIKSEEEEEPLE